MDKYNINLFVFELNLKNKRLGILYQRKLYLCEYQKEKNAPLNV